MRLKIMDTRDRKNYPMRIAISNTIKSKAQATIIFLRSIQLLKPLNSSVLLNIDTTERVATCKTKRMIQGMRI